MSARTPEERARSRAEARRRARLAARGELPSDDAEQEPAPPAPPARVGLLRRLFPPAPPLPNRPDPLEGFDPAGPLRPVRERLFLLRRNIFAWMIPSLIAFLGVFGSSTWGNDPIGAVATFLLFGSLIAAGWFGWQRPPLFGTTSALIAYLLVVLVAGASLLQVGATADLFGSPVFVTQTALQGAYLGLLGFLAGWYGGYLRRRQAQVSAESRGRSAPRRRR